MSSHAPKAQVPKSKAVADLLPKQSHQNATAQLRSFDAVAGKNVAQLQKGNPGDEHPVQRKANQTGLPDQLKSGIENLSGLSMDHVKVHYNSSAPAQLQAHAYAQGSDIHIAPGQEKHLPHEAWHVVQQAQGRVRPTMQMKSAVNVNDSPQLEREADVMGSKALSSGQAAQRKAKSFSSQNSIQLKRKRSGDEEKSTAQLVTQLKRDRKPADTESKDQTGTVQRVVKENVPDGTKIVIDNPGASDFGDTGIIRRPSRTVPKCKAVEFDNERGVLYRVYDYEMSPAASNETETEALPAVFSITAANSEHNIIITGEFDIGNPRMKEIYFTATKNGVNVGHISMAYYEGSGFVIPDIKTSKVISVPGLGTVLMLIASTMAAKLQQRIITLVATRFPPSDHPGPFYQKFGFKSALDLTSWGGDLAKYLTEKGNPKVNMTGDTAEVRQTTSHSLTGKGWAFSSWREGKN